MMGDADISARERAIGDILGRAGLPNAPLAMPKQVLERQPKWLFAIYARFLRRT
ncbi:MAG TPA: hypothetical protein VL418_03815 [Devosiaceae bacterium]|jgi:hypothetical protein|nr:hypothetical protein [Devosiaceae bacterium]